MLYAAWQEVVRSRSNEFALADLASGRRWTFRQLAEAAETGGSDEPVIFPCGGGPEFILEVLRAWRDGRIVCPLDAGQNRPVVEIPPKNCAHFKTTSGTAGAPRWVAFTAPQLAADAANIVQTMGLRADWPNLAAISLAHSYGFSNLVLPLLLHGVPLILAASRLPEAVRQAGQQFQCLTLAGVPALWRVWRDAAAIPSSVKLAISAGAVLPSALEREVFQSNGLKIHNFYGASECGGICYDASIAPRACDEDVGTPLHGVKIATAPDGCLIVAGAAVGETYWPAPDPSLSQGKFRAGDRIELRNGRVFLQGRHGDIINIAGQKVAPETIEQAILRCPGVRECVAFGVPDSSNLRAEVIVACVAGEVEVSALKRFVAAELPSWQAPRHWRMVSALADSTRGKISRAQWRRRFLEERE